jgi:hypothetical protein
VRFTEAYYSLVKLEAHCIMVTFAPAMADVAERHPVAGLHAGGSVDWDGLSDNHSQIAPAKLDHMTGDQAAIR